MSVEQNSEQLNAILDDLVKEYTDAMDEYIDKIRVFLEAGVEQLTLEELNNIMLRISTYNYFLAGRLEKAGIKSSVAQAVRDEAYNKATEILARNEKQKKNPAWFKNTYYNKAL